jgi:hypothetical protein
MTNLTNDNDASPTTPARPDPYGQAAMLLVESLIHGLVARSVISTQDAVDIVDTAAEVKVEMAIDIGEAPETLKRSLALIESIGSSLRHDLPPSDG